MTSILFTVLVSFLGNAKAGDNFLVSTENLRAGCSYYENNVYVSQEQKEIYRSSGYWDTEKCIDDAERMDALFTAANVLNTQIKVVKSNTPTTAFTLVTTDGSPVSIPAEEYDVNCTFAGQYWTQARLNVEYRGYIIYRTSRYNSVDDCEGDASLLTKRFQEAKSIGKKLNITHSEDEPLEDFVIAD